MQEEDADLWGAWLSSEDVELEPDFRKRARQMLVSLNATLAKWEADNAAGVELQRSDRDAIWLLPGRLIDIFFLGPDFESSLDQIDAVPRARALFGSIGFPGFGVINDSEFVYELAQSNRLETAELVLSQSREIYGENISCAAFLTAVLADVRRQQERWTDVNLLLLEATRMLAGKEDLASDFITFEARCRISGVRVQLETFLGRLNEAWRASKEELQIAQEYMRLFPSNLASVALFDAKDRALDLEYAVGRFALQAQRLGAELADSTDRFTEKELAILRFQLGRAQGAMERHDKTLAPRARETFRLGMECPELPELSLLNIEFSLIHLDLSQGALDLIPARLERAERLLELLGVGPSSGAQSRDLAQWQVLRSAYARRTNAPREELLEHLETVERSLMAMIDAWSQTPIFPGGVGYLRDDRRREVLGEHIQLCDAVGDMERALRQILAMQAQGSLARGAGADVPSLQELQAELVGDGGLVLFVPTMTLTHLLLVDAAGIKYVPLQGGRTLRELSADLDFAMLLDASGESGDLERAAKSLGDSLLPASIHEKIEAWRYVYFVGADLLANPRLELVPFGDSVLGCEMAMAYLPSLPLAVHLTRGRAAPRPINPASLVLIAGSLPGDFVAQRWPNLADITLDHEMWKRLGGELAQDGTQLLTGSRATRRALLESDLAQAKVLHIFNHGVFDGSRDLPAGLVLAESGGDTGLVWWDDVAKLDVPELVVLAACGGGRGPVRFGEDGISHLGGAFLSAGAQAVLLARSDLEIAASFEAMQFFHNELAAEKSPMKALLLARRHVMDTRGSTSLMSPLFLLGPAHHPLFTTRQVPWTALLGVALAFGFALALLVRKRRSHKRA